MPGEAARHAAGGRHDIDVGIALVLAGEGDAGAVGREDGRGFQARTGGEAPGGAAFPRHAPQVAGIDEHDVGAAQGRFLQQQRRVGRGPKERRQEESSERQGLHARFSIA